jgi:large subunit ribosomal protein L22
MQKNEFGNRANIIRLKNIRVAPRKLRVLVDMIRDMDVNEALTLLEYSDRAAARDIAKMIESGVSNIRQNLRDWDTDALYVHRAFVDEGPTLRRFRPRAQGRATRINKRTSKVTIELRPDEDEADA